MDFKTRLQILISVLLVTSCGGNLFQESAGKGSDAAKLENIQKAVNDERFDDAIEIIEGTSMTADSREKKNLFAAAYAGKCGVTFADLINALSAAAGAPVLYMMTSFSAITTDAASCETARQYLESIGNSTDRTLGENLSFFLVGFGKVGAFLKESADTAAPFGTVDPGFDACAAGDIPDNDIKEMISGFAMMIDTSAAVASYLGGSLGADLTSIGAVCGTSCVETDPSAISSAPDILNFRRATASNEFGVGACAIVACCP